MYMYCICTCICLHAPFWLQCLGKNPFWELVPGKMNMGILEFSSKQALFWKWLPRANHYAHETRIEILSRTPVSILRDLSPRPKTIGKTPKVVPLPECQPELLGYVHFTFFSHYFHIIVTCLWNMWFLYAQYRMDVTNIDWATERISWTARSMFLSGL